MRVLVFEPQSKSYGHEIINLEIIRALLTSNQVSEIVLIAQESWLKSIQENMFAFFDVNTSTDKIKYSTVIGTRDIFSARQFWLELTILYRYRHFDHAIFLSASPFSQLVVAILRLMSFTSASKQKTSLIYHGFLANLLPNRLRPDQWIYRNGFRIFFNPLRLILCSRLFFALGGTQLGADNILVLSTHIRSDVAIRNDLLSKRLKVVCPVFIFRQSIESREKTFVAESKEVRILILGRTKKKDIEFLITAVSARNRNVIFVVDSRMRNDLSTKAHNVVFVPLTSRIEIVNAAARSDLILLLRPNDEGAFRLSGVILESIALQLPIIVPSWIAYRIDHELFPIAFSYFDLEDLVNSLINDNFLLGVLGKVENFNYWKRSGQYFLNICGV